MRSLDSDYQSSLSSNESSSSKIICKTARKKTSKKQSGFQMRTAADVSTPSIESVESLDKHTISSLPIIKKAKQLLAENEIVLLEENIKTEAI